ncbi:hypothetical protein SFRURICE_013384 [Spodoptera frugiperda]|uniref:Uncharacterized protein LOC126910930 n=2 Tax=Spodoptera frugiperda TaxID=7108 RepID=A0A9R0DQ46_SPOFR|nr:uncharacterized protein LOC126910930 [Spodoptera frugiperda]KAF9823847.1 hypothetical protein SFRURICE_013384 [Spodoptera frugiperda]
MRNAFVVLVSLCIGVVSGFIVPSSLPEIDSKWSNITTESTSNATNDTSTTTLPSKFAVLPKSRNDIDEKDLYEHATEKQNNQNERAFIYINQKFKKPVRNRVIKISPLDKIVFATVPPPLMPNIPTPCPLGTRVTSNSYFQGFELSDKLPQDMASYFADPTVFRCKDNNNKKPNNKKPIKIAPDTAPLQFPPQPLNRLDERREYFELLKPPIVRPVSRLNNVKTGYDSMRQNEFPSLSPSNITPNKENYFKQYNLKSPYVSKPKPIPIRKEDLRHKNYGFDGSYIRPPFQAKDLVNKVEDVNFEGDFINDDDTHRLTDNNPEEDKLLDRYLKDTLEEQNYEKSNNNMPDCSYRDCILQSSKPYYVNSGRLVKPECKCGRRLNIKQIDPFVAKDRALREEGKHNDTDLRGSSEINYYEEMLSEDLNLIKQDDDVVRPPNKFNETSVH